MERRTRMSTGASGLAEPAAAPPARGWLRWLVLGALSAIVIGLVVTFVVIDPRADDRETASATDVVADGTEDTTATPGDDDATGDATEDSAPDTTTTTAPVPSSARTLVQIDTIGGDLSSKSVVASDDGFVVAQNMMYRHTVSVFDRDFSLVATIPDEIRPAAFGIGNDPDLVLRGAPVEASFSPDRSVVYVSNYHMYGPGYGPEPSDSCPRMSTDDSYVYRIDMRSLEIDQITKVGTVPKFLAVSPRGDYLITSNWCSYDASIVDLATGKEVKRLEIGRYPRGIAFTPDGATAYVGAMGGDTIVEVDMATLEARSTFPVSGRPRHLVMGPEGRYLYITRNAADDVVKVDLQTKEIVASVGTGDAPRSMDISTDGEALYVVNYFSNTMSKVLTADMTEVQELPTGTHPIGITYDDGTDRVWVANYSGTIQIFEDRIPD